jgi:pimeloyl-ACP methyl ester carboxylesterase
MPLIDLDGTSIYFERSGPATGRPLMLIHGFGAQLIAWHPELCDALVTAGFQVFRLDNRDVGLSGKWDGRPAYTLSDMAGDVAALITHLEIGPMHVIGQSMGGMIAQRLAIEHAGLVASLCLLNTTPHLGFITEDPEFVALADRPAAGSRDEAIQQWLAKERFSGSSGFDLLVLAQQVYDRCYCPDGMSRQWQAIQASPSVQSELHRITAPTAVVHGRADRLINFDASRVMAERIPDCDLHLYAGMGHEIPRQLWPELVQIVTRTSVRSRGSGGLVEFA